MSEENFCEYDKLGISNEFSSLIKPYIWFALTKKGPRGIPGLAGVDGPRGFPGMEGGKGEKGTNNIFIYCLPKKRCLSML